MLGLFSNGPEFIGTRSRVSPSTPSVVQGFLVSSQIAAIALCQAGYTDEATKREWLTQAIATLRGISLEAVEEELREAAGEGPPRRGRRD